MELNEARWIEKPVAAGVVAASTEGEAKRMADDVLEYFTDGPNPSGGHDAIYGAPLASLCTGILALTNKTIPTYNPTTESPYRRMRICERDTSVLVSRLAEMPQNWRLRPTSQI